MTGPADRLRALAAAAGYEHLSDFADKAGVAQPTMRQHIARDSVPKGAAELYVRAARGTGASADWLLFGTGRPPRSSNEPEEIAPRPPKQLMQSENSTVVIRELDVHAFAGHGADGNFLITQADASASMVGEYTFPAAGFRQVFGANASDIIIAEVRGDSMVPTLFPGQKVMVHIADTKPTPPGIFYLWDGMGLVIKRVELIPGSNPPTVRIKSDNPQYETYERTVEEAQINGRVILGFQRF